jgi:hypothetical protein
MKIIRLITLISFIMVLFSNCEKVDRLEFGATLSNLQVDSIYKASTDGLLVIQTTANYVSTVVGYVYCDFKSVPDSLVGKLYDNDNATFPIMKDSNWRVHKRSFTDPNISVSMEISWTPLN